MTYTENFELIDFLGGICCTKHSLYKIFTTGSTREKQYQTLHLPTDSSKFFEP